MRACILLLAVLVPWVTVAQPGYFFSDFEAEGGWTLGPLPERESAVQALQGDVEIFAETDGASRQVLRLGPSEDYAVAYVDAAPFAAQPVVFCEVLARPFAVEANRDEEFIDLGGAILGFFRVGQQGEVRGLYAKSPQENVWISTGLRFDLGPDGLPTHWLRITIRLDRIARTWSVSINDVPAVVALRTVSLPADSPLPLWLYGDVGHSTFFDDLLISTIAPNELEKLLALPARPAIFPPRRPGQQIVTQSKPTQELRRAQDSAAKPGRLAAQPSALSLRGWHLSLDTGRQKIDRSLPLDERRNEPGIVAYAPGYDDEGRPLPAVITITADTELRPGLDLSRLRWEVAELKGWPDKVGEIAGRGDFRSGLVQNFTLTPEWARRATRIAVWVQE
jgi:hypothetical protein